MTTPMKTHAKLAVIGGGLIGCSILYHLAKLGWRDVVLLERDELTSGSTWHAAANIHGLHDNNNISKLQYYTMRLYRELEAETGQSCGIFQPGSLYLAQSEAREHQLRIQAAKARQFGVEFYELSPKEALDLHPLLDLEGVRAIMFEKDGGNVDPSGVTTAYARGARQLGAEIYRFTRVLATKSQPDGSWHIRTNKGEIKTQIIVNAAGLWAREVAALAGVDLPLIPMEHQYLVTESMAEITGADKRLPSVADRDGEYYLRQEGDGLLVGAYEKDGRFWAEDGTPPDFGHELFDDDLDRISENYLRAIKRVPALENAGIKRVINGPMIWSPDSSALFGPVPELANYYCCAGIIPGFSQSGGLGSQLAQWIVEGESELDMFAWDLARFGAWADKRFTKARALDQYAHRFKIHFPNEEREAGRPVRTRPIYEKQKTMGALFGINYGWEHPQWFAASPAKAHEEYGFTRQSWWKNVGEECRHLRAHVGVIDISNFAKYRITGKGAADWLDRIVANKVPRSLGRTCLTPLLGRRGGIAGDFTLACLAEDEYFMIGSGMAERYHSRYFNAVARPEGVSFESLSEGWVGFNIAGPNARTLMSRLSNADFSNDAFPFMRAARLQVMGIDALALRVSFTGDLGWEIHCPEEHQEALYDALLSQEDLRARPIGARALMSLRLEKGYGSWGREYSPEYWPQEVGYAGLVKDQKPEFLGRQAWLGIKDLPPREKLCFIRVPVTDNDASGGESVFDMSGAAIGRVTSGGYSYSDECSIALAMIKAGNAGPGQVNVAILGVETPAEILAEPVFDPKGDRLRS